MKKHSIVVRDPKICGGAPTIRGTRVLLDTILASLASGDTADVLIKSFPSLTHDDIKEVIAYAAAETLKSAKKPRRRKAA